MMTVSIKAVGNDKKNIRKKRYKKKKRKQKIVDGWYIRQMFNVHKKESEKKKDEIKETSRNL